MKLNRRIVKLSQMNDFIDDDYVDASMKVFKALSEFGAPLEEIGPNSFEQKGIMFQIGVAPCRIDIIT
ncbi:MAG: hypothetical protein ACUZ8N_15250 [Candidatus Scalindua sp.]